MLDGLALPAFFAGILTFLAPCTLPLLPGYLGFISGATASDLSAKDTPSSARRRVVLNGLLYVVGFTFVFVVLGSIFGLSGAVLAPFRGILSRIGGVIIIFFGLWMVRVIRLPFFSFLENDRRLPVLKLLTPGRPLSSFLFGATFAFGWTPCIGPVLATILFLSAGTGTALTGAILLLIFATGLAVPYMLTALLIGHTMQIIRRLTRILGIVSVIGGVFLIVIGILLVTDSFSIWTSFLYRVFQFLHCEGIYDYL